MEGVEEGRGAGGDSVRSVCGAVPSGSSVGVHCRRTPREGHRPESGRGRAESRGGHL